MLVLSAVFPPRIGGSGRWLWELFRRLEGHDVRVVATDAPGAAEFDATSPLRIIREPLEFSNWGLIDPRGGHQYLRAALRINRLVTEFRPDMIHCGRALPEGLLGLMISRWRGLPFSCFAHGEELTLADKSRELRYLSRRVLAGAAAVIANTRHTKEIVVNGFGVSPEKVIVLHPGVDATQFTPAAPDPTAREALGWTGRRVVLTVGALTKRKGQDMMIRALPAIRRRCPDVLYAIVGEGLEKKYLQDLVAEHHVDDLVQFRGIPSDDHLIRCYQQCDLFALANRQVDWDIEGFGIVLLEAQACGKPVIAGASGGTQEAIDPGQTGELVKCETPEPLADAVCAFLENPRKCEEFGARGRRWVVERFDWPVLARQANQALQKDPSKGD